MYQEKHLGALTPYILYVNQIINMYVTSYMKLSVHNQ